MHSTLKISDAILSVWRFGQRAQLGLISVARDQGELESEYGYEKMAHVIFVNRTFEQLCARDKLHLSDGFLGVACSGFFALSDYSATGHLLTLTRRRNDSSDIEIMFGSIRFLPGTNLLDNCCLRFSYHRLIKVVYRTNPFGLVRSMNTLWLVRFYHRDPDLLEKQTAITVTAIIICLRPCLDFSSGCSSESSAHTRTAGRRWRRGRARRRRIGRCGSGG